MAIALFSTAAGAEIHAAEICDQAAAVAARETGVPLSVLQAITRTETGRTRDGRMQPWSWTVNMEGAGVWFDDEATAKTYVGKHYGRGARSFDVGCFQINYKWHGHEFSSIDEMFDPIQNARYAARFLMELFREFGDWSKAAGAYHSRTRTHAEKYSRRFDRIHAQLADRSPTERYASDRAGARSVIRPNQFPLLQAGLSAPRLGSLVPLGTGRGSLFAGPAEGL